MAGQSSRKGAVVQWSVAPHWSSTLAVPVMLSEWSLITAGETFTGVICQIKILCLFLISITTCLNARLLGGAHCLCFASVTVWIMP